MIGSFYYFSLFSRFCIHLPKLHLSVCHLWLSIEERIFGATCLIYSNAIFSSFSHKALPMEFIYTFSLLKGNKESMSSYNVEINRCDLTLGYNNLKPLWFDVLGGDLGLVQDYFWFLFFFPLLVILCLYKFIIFVDPTLNQKLINILYGSIISCSLKSTNCF